MALQDTHKLHRGYRCLSFSMQKKKKKKLKIGARVCLNIFTDVRCVTVDDWNEFIMQP